MSSRRQILRLGAAGIVAASGAGATYLHTQNASAGEVGKPKPTPATSKPVSTPAAFTVPLSVPPTLRPSRVTRDTDYYDVTIGKSYANIVPGARTEVLTYNGSFPGPTIRARSGRKVVVRQKNHLNEPATVHLHGGATEQASDGSAMDPIKAGESKIFTYHNLQPHANLWMHDHTHHLESEHLFRGLANLYLLTDKIEESLPLPKGKYDVPLMLSDTRLDDKGQLVYTMDDAFQRTTLLVNGRPRPYFKVDARKYRFRLVNTSNLRMFWLSLSDGTPLTVIGADGGLLPAPYETERLLISPGERADLIIDFSKYPPGTQLILKNDLPPGDPELIGQVIRFDVGRPAPDKSSIPATLRSLPAIGEADTTRQMVMYMDEVGAGTNAFLNGKAFDPDRIDIDIKHGTTEEWILTNTSQTIPHNFHTHLVQFRVTGRNGGPATGFETGLKDTVLLWPGEFVTLRATFDTYKGVFPYHCHMVDHSAMGMMAQLRVS
ncbi:multicopper oxidase family protein [Actinoplanes bogorensis]|uniref:Multicopper oxidase CueO n=1 Tax=Paractinoplanes bogorensis TaxID=1610840 RepID=A0ABS5YKA5_9ACTN|nr:multicopper oxidase family protein [Actinoplanes bogorensis]MBU2663833.1 multicopper oxidase family protein [Actinoplanes bogorensis]